LKVTISDQKCGKTGTPTADDLSMYAVCPKLLTKGNKIKVTSTEPGQKLGFASIEIWVTDKEEYHPPFSKCYRCMKCSVTEKLVINNDGGQCEPLERPTCNCDEQYNEKTNKCDKCADGYINTYNRGSKTIYDNKDGNFGK